MMKTILLMILFLLPLWGDMDAQIEAIQRAPVAERFKLMNDFKKKIVKMHEEERLEAMTKLQTITQSKQAMKAIRALKEKTKTHRTKKGKPSKYHERDDEIDDLRDDDRGEERDDDRGNERDEND